jgi:hydrogenase maturation protease
VTRILVLGLGQRYRGDDSLGLLVAGGLRERPIPWVEATECSGNAFDLMASWEGRDRVIAIDCVHSEERSPGIVRGFFGAEAVRADTLRCSTHGGGLPEAWDVGQALGNLPRQFAVIGIIGRSFAIGDAPGPEVSRAVALLVSAWPPVEPSIEFELWIRNLVGEVNHA